MAFSLSKLVAEHAVDNTIIATFSNARQLDIMHNWIYHLQMLPHLRAGLLVGLMNMKRGEPNYVTAAAALRATGVGIYAVNSPEVKNHPQGGRWFHVLPLLRTGVRLLLSDADAVWLRDPLVFLRTLELRHPKLDFAVSTDAQFGTDGLRVTEKVRDGRGRRRMVPPVTSISSSSISSSQCQVVHGCKDDLDVELHTACKESFNIGIMYFPPGARPGSLRLLEEATAHLSSSNNLRRVDQGPLNFRWKHGAGAMNKEEGAWRWEKQLHGIKDSSGKRLCGLVNGSVVGGVLPSAQFANTLTFGVLELWRQHRVAPYVLHATWMRQQLEPFKVMRLREAGLWKDPPDWYDSKPLQADGRIDGGFAAELSLSTKSNGFVTFDLKLPDSLIAVPRRTPQGHVPLHHFRLMHKQLQLLRNALFVARVLGRALVLPEILCTCEMGNQSPLLPAMPVAMPALPDKV